MLSKIKPNVGVDVGVDTSAAVKLFLRSEAVRWIKHARKLNFNMKLKLVLGSIAAKHGN